MTKLDEITAIFGGIWRTPGVTDQPVITLIRWRVFEIQVGSRKGERHLVGYNQEDWEGRVSTAIVSIDVAAMQCATKSGRVYKLVGPSGYDADGDYVWRAWARVNCVSGERDVSSEVEDQMMERTL